MLERSKRQARHYYECRTLPASRWILVPRGPESGRMGKSCCLNERPVRRLKCKEAARYTGHQPSEPFSPTTLDIPNPLWHTALCTLAPVTLSQAVPKPLNADWDGCKALYLTGVTLKAVATQTGVSYVALRARSHREGWSQLAVGTSQHLQQLTLTTLEERAKAWPHRVAGLMERSRKQSPATSDNYSSGGWEWR